MDYWHKQDINEPLFKDIEWSLPENKQLAGKLLIIGGQQHALTAPLQTYQSSLQAGIGSVRVILPDATKKVIGNLADGVLFAPSTPSGSFAEESLALILENCAWADGICLAGDFGRNSETAILLEKIMQKSKGLICLGDDAVEQFYAHPQQIINRSQTIIVCQKQQLQKLLIQAGSMIPIYNGMNVLQLAEALYTISSTIAAVIVIAYDSYVFVAYQGQVSSTKLENATQHLQSVVAYSSVLSLQLPTQKIFEAITTSQYLLTKKNSPL